jgi:predicted Zn-dependent peptidase
VFGIQAATSEEDLTELVPLALEELHKMTDGVTRAELDRAKAQLRAGLLMALESPIARAGQIARHILVHGRPLTLEEMVENVESVSGEDLAALAGEMLSNPTTLAAIGPVRQLPSLADLSARMSGGKTAVGF